MIPKDKEFDFRPVHDAGRNTVGYHTEDGTPVYGADKSEAAMISDIREKEKIHRDSPSKRDRSHLLRMADVDPEKVVQTIRELTYPEQKAIEWCLNPKTCCGYDLANRPDSVSLPIATSHLLKTKSFRNGTKHRAEVEMSRAFNRLYTRGLGTVKKDSSGLVSLTISRERIRDLIHSEADASRHPQQSNIYLMKVPCVSQTIPKSHAPKAKLDPSDVPRNATGERLNAVRLLKGVKMLDETDRTNIDMKFSRYLSETEEKIIALMDGTSGELKGMEYSTRFNDLAKVAKSLDKFDYALESSFMEHSKAVFLTLTTDPNLRDEERAAIKSAKLAKLEKELSSDTLSGKRLKYAQKRYWQVRGPDAEIEELERRSSTGTASQDDLIRLRKLLGERDNAQILRDILADPKTGIRTKERAIQSLKKLNRWEYKWDPEGFSSNWEANRSFSPAWNKLMSYLKKKIGYRPKYLAAFEFTESGLLHIHVLIFVEYLASIDDLALEWRRIGQGEVSYIYSLKAVPSRSADHKWEWRWNAQSRPKDAEGMDGGSYLKKYVKKAMLAMLDDHTSPARIQSLYWAFNKRFNSCSKDLVAGFEDKKEESDIPSRWSMWKVLNPIEAEDILGEFGIVYHRVTRERLLENRRRREEAAEAIE